MADDIKSEKKRVRKALTQERLKELLHYDPETGVFKWKQERRGGEFYSVVLVKVGDIAGSLRSGERGYRHWKIGVDGENYRAHRLAWFYMKGEWPKIIDHKDGDALNNRLSNLRLATDTQNLANAKKRVGPKIKSQFKGVSLMSSERKKPWIATISCNKKRRHLGYFATEVEAHAAYAKAAKELFGEYARTE